MCDKLASDMAGAKVCDMTTLTNDRARELFKESGLTYADLTYPRLQRLRDIINDRMIDSGCFRGSFRCHAHLEFQTSESGRFWAGIKCEADYFDDREAVSFNDDGFIGFAGWASSKNVAPILEGFSDWINEVKP